MEIKDFKRYKASVEINISQMIAEELSKVERETGVRVVNAGLDVNISRTVSGVVFNGFEFSFDVDI
jgi:hypothetical protein